jgi:cation:H+ antiporter
MLFFLSAFIISFFLLMRSSLLLVSSLSGFARLFRISEYMIAFILMSFATSIPELFVGINSALNRVPILSLGNVLGSNLLNMTVVMGLAAFLNGGLTVDNKISRTNFWLAFILAIFPFFLGYDGLISRSDGLILIISFFIYIWHVIAKKEYFSKIAGNAPIGIKGFKKTVHDLIFFLIALALLLISSWIIVWSGKQISNKISFGLLSFGILFVSLGTVLPELAFGIRAALGRHGSMAVGNSIGSIAFNAAFIIGLASLIHPITITGFNQFFFAGGSLIFAFISFNFFI